MKTCDNPNCDNSIPPEKLAKRGHRYPQFSYCSRACRVEADKLRGFYQEMSTVGKEARSEAVTQSNREHPRRRKH